MRLGTTATCLLLLSLVATEKSFAWTDGLAELDSDTCERDEHCLNGGKCQALDTNSSKHCSCPEGYNGLRCEKHCPLECANGGRCYLTHYQGEHDRNHEEFMAWDSKTSNAQSIDVEKAARNADDSTDFNDYACHCKGLFTGYLCDVPYTNCGDMTRCFSGGQCQIDSLTEPCKCASGYSGRYCQLQNGNGDEKNLEGLPQMQEYHDSNSKKPWPLILGSIGVGSVLGIAAFIWKERHRRYYSNWLVSSGTGGPLEDDASTRTFVNVI